PRPQPSAPASVAPRCANRVPPLSVDSGRGQETPLPLPPPLSAAPAGPPAGPVRRGARCRPVPRSTAPRSRSPGRCWALLLSSRRSPPSRWFSRPTAGDYVFLLLQRRADATSSRLIASDPGASRFRADTTTCTDYPLKLVEQLAPSELKAGQCGHCRLRG